MINLYRKGALMDIKLLTFIKVVELESFTRAGEALNITQPAVSQHIKVLERQYDVKLFHKKGKKITITEEGKVLHEYALQINRLYKSMNREMSNASSISKTYRVGSTLTIGGYVLPIMLGAYKKIKPNIDIILLVENTQTVLDKLFKGDIAFGVVEGSFDKAKVKHQRLKEDELILVVSPDHPFASLNCVTIDELIASRLILREYGSGTRQLFENELKKRNVFLDNIYMEIGDINALISLVSANMGCTIISKEAVKDSLIRGSLVEVPLPELDLIREFNFVYIDDRYSEIINDLIEVTTKTH